MCGINGYAKECFASDWFSEVASADSALTTEDCRVQQAKAEFGDSAKTLANEHQKKEVLRPLVYRNTSSPISRETTNGLDLEA